MKARRTVNDSTPLSRAAIRELDRAAIEDYGIPGMLLMENAGRAAAAEADALLVKHGGNRAIIMAGKGNNGGDGFVIARHLFNRGREAAVIFAGDPSSFDVSSDAGRNAEIARRMGIPIHPFPGDAGEEAPAAMLKSSGLAVDALFGTGLRGAARPPASRLIEMINTHARCVLAVDIPSGLDADSGVAYPPCVRAEVTVTFAARKLGFTRGDGPAHTGRVVLAEISIPRMLIESAGETAR